MKAHTLEISWHGKEPVLSVDQHNDRLATGGADNDVKIWRVTHDDEGNVQVTFLANLCRHTKSVNAVRFSPSGEYLASAGDDGAVVLWKKDDRPEKVPIGSLEKNSDECVETWIVVHLMRSHVEDVYDLAWSPSSDFLASASVDNTVHIWDVGIGKSIQHIKDHKHYVQGVAWSPNGDMLATQSSDRTCRVYTRKQKKGGSSWEFRNHTVVSHMSVNAPKTGDAAALTPSKCADTTSSAPVVSTAGVSVCCTEEADKYIDKGVNETASVGKKPQNDTTTMPKLATNDVPPRTVRLYQDENGGQSFFRRLNFSPDGTLLATPCGVDNYSLSITAPGASASNNNNTSFFFAAQKSFSSPVFHTPCAGAPSNEVKFCPLAFELRKTKSDEKPLLDLPYRLVFAVMAVNSVVFYDTQSMTPFALISDLHYAPLTDIAWSSDGTVVAISSQDGYCSLVSFEEGELGTSVPFEQALETSTETATLSNKLENTTANSSFGQPRTTFHSPSVMANSSTNAAKRFDPDISDIKESSIDAAVDHSSKKSVKEEMTSMQSTVNPSSEVAYSSETPRRIATKHEVKGTVITPRRVIPTLLTTSPLSTTTPTSSIKNVDPSPAGRLGSEPPSKKPRRISPVLITTTSMSTGNNSASAGSTDD
eukprot:CFRG6160T1